MLVVSPLVLLFAEGKYIVFECFRNRCALLQCAFCCRGNRNCVFVYCRAEVSPLKTTRGNQTARRKAGENKIGKELNSSPNMKLCYWRRTALNRHRVLSRLGGKSVRWGKRWALVTRLSAWEGVGRREALPVDEQWPLYLPLDTGAHTSVPVPSGYLRC